SPPRPNTGAELLQLGRGLCGEFTRLTVTLARASGLPARETHSFGMFAKGPASNDHAWADVYLPGSGWIPVQPQESLPGAHRYPLHYYRYLVVYRGDSYSSRSFVVELERASLLRSSGAGLFVPTPARERPEVMRLLCDIASDDGRDAAALFRRVSAVDAASRPVLWWTLSASTDSSVGQRAAAALVECCRDDDLDLDAFLQMSPTLVRLRIERALGHPDMPPEAVRFRDSAYFVFDEQLSWHGARKYCERLGGHLVSITDAEEQKFVQGLPELLGKGHRFWIGLSTVGSTSDWQWVTGEAWNYSNWATGLPDPTRPLWSKFVRPECRRAVENAAAFGYSPHRWVDADPLLLKGFICEWPIDAGEPPR
ncbi:MAG: hypothetical protein KDC38_02840, partial [Planctomycetes bacterium]|nr:hypothetical protein [Planctomycetota bacterium]